MNALLIDHDDSFTYNLRHWLKPLCQEIQVINHREISRATVADLVILSPGPRSPQHYPHVLEYLKSLSADQAVYGVCLGMQMMVEAAGGKISAYTPPLHGKKSRLQILDSQFSKFENLEVARYHSLMAADLGTDFFVAATSLDRIPMWIKHKDKKWMGVQFHPESFLTELPALHLQAVKDWLMQ